MMKILMFLTVTQMKKKNNKINVLEEKKKLKITGSSIEHICSITRRKQKCYILILKKKKYGNSIDSLALLLQSFLYSACYVKKIQYVVK